MLEIWQCPDHGLQVLARHWEDRHDCAECARPMERVKFVPETERNDLIKMLDRLVSNSRPEAPSSELVIVRRELVDEAAAMLLRYEVRA